MGKTRTRAASGITLDTGALIALERGDRRMIALLRQAVVQGRTIRVFSGVVAQAWRDGRGGRGQIARRSCCYQRSG